MTGAREIFCTRGISSMWEIRHPVWVTNTEHIPAMQNGHTLGNRRLCVCVRTCMCVCVRASMCVRFDIHRERIGGKKGGMDVPHRFLPPAHVMWFGVTPQLLPPMRGMERTRGGVGWVRGWMEQISEANVFTVYTNLVLSLVLFTIRHYWWWKTGLRFT